MLRQKFSYFRLRFIVSSLLAWGLYCILICTFFTFLCKFFCDRSIIQCFVFFCLQDLLNFDDPLNIEAAEHYLRDKKDFEAKVRYFVDRYAKRWYRMPTWLVKMAEIRTDWMQFAIYFSIKSWESNKPPNKPPPMCCVCQVYGR